MEADTVSADSSPDPVVDAYKAGVDRSLLRQNLRLTAEQRLEQLEEMARFHDELRRAARALHQDK
jgi:hypothetical protein